jgi:hypothetical protein
LTTLGPLSFHSVTAERWPDLEKLFGETGLVSAFEQAGFKESDSRSPARPIMRLARASRATKKTARS